MLDFIKICSISIDNQPHLEIFLIFNMYAHDLKHKAILTGGHRSACLDIFFKILISHREFGKNGFVLSKTKIRIIKESENYYLKFLV